MQTSYRSIAIIGLFLVGFVGSTSAVETVELNGQTFTLPDGFSIEVVAKSPLVDRPITASFDEVGRLYVADSSGSNDKVEKQLAEKPHRIVRLEDSDGDGVFDKSVVFADRMMFPEGTLWHAGSLYVAAPPSIWKLTDENDDGIADRREEWFQGKTLTGCANDLHGPYLGRDGRIYWCKGAFAEQTYERPGQKPFVTRASHIFRSRPDGADIEPVMTGGMDNPVDVVFTPEGERIFSCTFLQHPAGGNRDGLIHALYGGVYGKVHDVIQSHPRTGVEVLPPMTHLGPAAPCGLHYYESQEFGDDYQGSVFTALFNLQRVIRHRLVRDGGTFKTEDTDFVVSDNRDFHPTDVLEDADGSLLVVDTGGWYKLCCPTSQLVKPDVLGAIYRVRRKDAHQVDDPRGLALPSSKLAPDVLPQRLADARPAVRERAIAELAAAGHVATLRQTLALDDSPLARQNAVWALTRIDAPEARAAVRGALSDTDPSVCHAALHSISLWRDRDALPKVISVARKPNLAIRRAAAEALGRIGSAEAVSAILELLAVPSTKDGSANDVATEHSLTYALIEIGAAKEIAAGLTHSSPAVRRGVFVALDQLESDYLTPSHVADELIAERSALRPTAQWILSRHPEWGDTLVPALTRQLSRTNLSAKERVELEEQLAELAGNLRIQQLLAERLAADAASNAERLSALRAMSQAHLRETPGNWIESLRQALEVKDKQVVAEAIITSSRLTLTDRQLESLQPALVRHAAEQETPSDIRLRCLALVKGTELSEEQFNFLHEQVADIRDASQRSLALTALHRTRLTPEQAAKVVDHLALTYLSPADAEIILLIAARHHTYEMGQNLLRGITNSAYMRSIPTDFLERTLKPFGPVVVKRAVEAHHIAKENAAASASKLEALDARLPEGDIRRGQAVFNSAKVNCASCHAIGYLGGKVGPDLTKIGAVRTRNDLLESILYPSASFVRSYEPYVVLTTDGTVESGILRNERPGEIVLVKDAKQTVRIPRDRVEDLRAGIVSIMPDGLQRQLSDQELADLLAFLQACK